MDWATEKPSWESRKNAALLLYADKDYETAANLIKSAKEVPFVSADIAICVKVWARTHADDAIRLLKEVGRRTARKPEWCLSLASAFQEQGMPILAARFYGAALSVSNVFYENGFEEKSLWCDDRKTLVSLWRSSGQLPSPPTSAPIKNFIGNAMSFYEYTQKITLKAETQESPKLPALPPSPIIKPESDGD